MIGGRLRYGGAARFQVGENRVDVVNADADRYRHIESFEPGLLVEDQTGGRELGHGLARVSHVQTQLTGARQTGSVLQVEFDWHVGTAYLAQLSGVLNLKTGAVVMNGPVAEGQYAGSQVHEEGQRYDPARSCFAGTIRMMPASG